MSKIKDAIGMRLALAYGALSAPLKRDEGQTFVEYALILAIIGVGLVVVLGILRTDIANLFSKVGADL